MKKQVILDIGHGRNTQGKGVPGLKEFDFNQNVVRYAKKYLEHAGVTVFLTQQFDSDDVPLKTRSDYANRTGAPLLISFHANAFSDATVKGHMAFHWYNSTNGKRIAETWQDNAHTLLLNNDRGLVQCKPGEWTDFHIIREVKMPAILIEHAFMTNPGDLKLLRSEEFRLCCAIATVQTTLQFLEML